MTLQLRPYQTQSIEALFDHWGRGGGNGLIVIPTGGGKSLIIATLLKQLLESYPMIRIGCVTHSKELIAQNYQELLRIWPQAPAGIYSAGIGRRDTRHPILFCGIQSVWNKTDRIGHFDLLLIDEAHLISRNSNTMYGQFLDAIKAKQPDLRVVGLTATPYRLDSGRLDKGEDRLFDTIVYEANVADLIHDGYLSPLVSKGTHAEIDVKGVHRRGGEFIPAELEAAAMSGDLVTRAAAEIVQRGTDRRAWLCFCTGIDHAAAVRDAIAAHGIAAEMVDGGMPKAERDRIIKSFRNGALRCLTSVNVLSIGFNVPHVDLVALLRPTESTGLYIQQVGRGFRLAQGKANCLVLDFAGNVRKHGPVDLVDPADKSKKASGQGVLALEGEARAKVCPNCESYVHPRVMECPDCGFIWQEKPKHEAKADDVAVMSGKTSDGWVPVSDVSYYKHVKRGGSAFAQEFNKTEAPPTLRASYGCGATTINAWYCFSHPQGSLPQRKAAGWWLEAGGQHPVPASVEQALDRIAEVRAPEAIKFKKSDSGFNEITARRYARAAEEVAA